MAPERSLAASARWATASAVSAAARPPKSTMCHTASSSSARSSRSGRRSSTARDRSARAARSSRRSLARLPAAARRERSPFREAGIGLSELGRVAGRLLEVVADDLVALDEDVAVLVEPVGEPGMQVGADRLGECVVGGVADQQVTEAIAVVARELSAVGTHELAPHECGEPGRDLRLLGSERLHAAAVEDLALDGAALEHPALGLVELVEAGRQQRLQRGRHVDVAILGRHREHLRDEERVAARRAGDPLAQLARDGVADQRVRLLRGERLEAQRPGPARTPLERARAGPCTGAGAARRPRAARSTRPGRGTSPRPTGCRRRPPRAAPAPRAVSGTPRRSRHRSSQTSDSPRSERIAAAAAGSDGRTASCFTTSTTGQYVIPSP